MDVRVGLWRKLSAKELMLFNCGCWRRLLSPLDCKEIQPVHSEGDQPWVFFGRNKAVTPVLWPPHVKSWLIGKDSDAGRDWGQEEKGTTEDEMVRCHWLNGHGFGWTPGVGDGQGGLVCCGSWGCKELDTAEQLNWTELKISLSLFPHLFVMKWWDQMPWSSFSECWVFSQIFYSPLSPSPKRLFTSSLLSVIRVVSSTYLRLLIFLLAILIPAYGSSSPTFLMMYSA